MSSRYEIGDDEVAERALFEEPDVRRDPIPGRALAAIDDPEARTPLQPRDLLVGATLNRASDRAPDRRRHRPGRRERRRRGE